MKSAAASRIQLHFLPPYCPDHNRIEQLWRDPHDNVPGDCARGNEDLMREVRLYLNARNQRRRYTYRTVLAAADLPLTIRFFVSPAVLRV